VPVVWTMAFAVAWSRIYLASHWPLDVLGGIALGVLSGWGCGWWWWGQRRPAPDGETECVLQQS
jgi:membrane-associated phospholipid phosphatase